MLQKLSQCLGVTDPTNITDLILCADLLSNPKTPWNISIDVLEKLKGWWQRCVAGSGPDPHMTSDLYKKLVARLVEEHHNPDLLGRLMLSTNQEIE